MTISAQMQKLELQEQRFHETMENEAKVAKAKRELKSTQVEVSSSYKMPESKDGKPLMCPALAFLLAVKDSTDARLKDITQHVQAMMSNDSQIDRAKGVLSGLMDQESVVMDEDPDQINQDQILLNAKTIMANAQVSALTQTGSQEGAYMSQDTAFNTADANIAKTMIQMIYANLK